LIVFVIFRLADHRWHWAVALGVTYGLGAYLVLPYVVRMGLKILNHQHVPRYTITGDGLPGDPVNLVLLGTRDQLRAAFKTAEWLEADRLSVASSMRMTKAFIFKIPYPTAPFSTLFLFGRGQDIGFQKAIDNNPRKRHHIRFWALELDRARATVNTSAFWLNRDRPSGDARVLWVGAGTRDTGLGMTRITFKITHATDSDTNAERDFIMNELSGRGVIGEVTEHKTGDSLEAKSINHYVTDGDVALATLREARQ
jgi:hypothetical protein